MTFDTIRWSATSATALLVALPAAAQDFYVGVGGEYASGTRSDFNGEDDRETSVGYVLAGATFDLNGRSYVGGEVETSFGDIAVGDQFSKGGGDAVADRRIRLRGIYGMDMGDYSLFFGFGVTRMSGESLGSEPVVPVSELDGYNIGVGVDFDITPSVGSRVELIYDDLSGSGGDSFYDVDYSSTSLRAAVTYKF